MTVNSLFNAKEFSLNQIKNKFINKQLWPNPNYQRSKVWGDRQKKELINSIEGNYPIGALTIFEKRNRLEVLDGQQRIWTISEFLNDELTNMEGKKFSELSELKQDQIKAYTIPAIELNSKLSEKEASEMFVRLQEGTALKTAEKVYAFTGIFKEVFVEAFFDDHNDLFFGKLSDKRFRARLIAAHLLAIELLSNLKDEFPDIDYPSLKKINAETKSISNNVQRNYNKNIQFLGLYLHPMLGAMRIREITPAYMLVSYFRKTNAITKRFQGLIFKDFMLEFVHDLNKFSIYDEEPPEGLPLNVFQRLMAYKSYARQGLTKNSLKNSLRIIKDEYERRVGKIEYKDKNRLFTREQKITLYFDQKGKCDKCKQEIHFETVDAHHVVMHSLGGRTEISNGKLVHKKCHKEINKNQN